MESADPDDAALLDAKLLRLFDVLYTARSVTRSAELLGQSKPTISIWLARLRRIHIGGAAGADGDSGRSGQSAGCVMLCRHARRDQPGRIRSRRQQDHG